MAQSVKHPTFHFSSGLDIRVLSSRPALGSIWTWGLLRKRKKEREREEKGKKKRKRKMKGGVQDACRWQQCCSILFFLLRSFVIRKEMETRASERRNPGSVLV